MSDVWEGTFLRRSRMGEGGNGVRIPFGEDIVRIISEEIYAHAIPNDNMRADPLFLIRITQVGRKMCHLLRERQM